MYIIPQKNNVWKLWEESPFWAVTIDGIKKNNIEGSDINRYTKQYTKQSDYVEYVELLFKKKYLDRKKWEDVLWHLPHESEEYKLLFNIVRNMEFMRQ